MSKTIIMQPTLTLINALAKEGNKVGVDMVTWVNGHTVEPKKGYLILK